MYTTAILKLDGNRIYNKKDDYPEIVWIFKIT